MSNFVVDLKETKNTEARETVGEPKIARSQTPRKGGRFGKILRVFGVLLITFLIVGGIGGYFYWQFLKRTPQYSLALLIDAARRDDQKALDALVDTDAMVDDFMPQITNKAVELYGRNLPPAILAKLEQAAEPLLPAVKIRARAEIPALIRDKTKKFDRVPFWAIALAAGRYVDIKQESDKATVAAKFQPEQNFNLTMKRGGDKWRLVGIKDEKLAKQIAEKIGQQIIFAANKNGIIKAGEQFGVQNLGELIRQLDGVFK